MEARGGIPLETGSGVGKSAMARNVGSTYYTFVEASE